MDAVPLLQVVAVGSALGIFGQACHAQFDAFGMLRQDFGVILFCALARAALVTGLVPHFGLMGGAVGFAASSALEPIAYLVMKWRWLPSSMWALAGVAIRPIMATGGMALVLWRLDLLSVMPAADIGGSIGQLALAALAGAGSYCGLVLTLWWCAGQPRGAEADIVAMVGRRQRGAPAEVGKSAKR
jgi:O-antigen/teichoic acid export membrane protein